MPPVEAPVPLRLNKLGLEDDLEAFLITFERVASAAGLAPMQWATLLAAYLKGIPQAAYQALSKEHARNYKSAILDALDISPNTYRRWFQGKTYPPEPGPETQPRK